MKVLRLTQPAQFSTDLAERPIVASGKVTAMADYRYPAEPPSAWFARRDFDSAQPVEVSADGQVFGHVATWGASHIGMGRKVKPPRSRSRYSHYLIGHVLCADGTQVRTGPVYIHCDHADLSLNEHQAREFMAHTGSAVADVAVYEDRFGIQIAGALRPDATPAQVRALRGSDISPDWRPMGGGHEMVGMIAVNTSGFITPALVASGQAQARKVADGRLRVQWDEVNDQPLAMVAVGMLHHAPLDPLEQLRLEIEPIRGFMADLQASKLMEQFGESNVFRDIEARAEAAVARAQSILDRAS